MSAKNYLTSLFDSQVTYKYVTATLRPGRFHIYTGLGNSGRNRFVNHLIGALAHMRPWSISTPDLLSAPLSNLKNASLLIASNWDERTPVPVDRMLELLRAGHLVVLCSPLIPRFSTHSNELMAATTVHTFKDRGEEDFDQPNEDIVVDKLLEDIIFGREAVYAKPPTSMTTALKELSPPSPNTAQNTVAFYPPEDASQDPKYSAIHITMNRAEKDKESPDSLTIAVDLSSDGFIVTLKQPAMKSSATCYLPYNGLFDYLGRFFAAPHHSISPYETVVFNAPFFPCVTVRSCGVAAYLKELQSQIEWLCEDWPLN